MLIVNLDELNIWTWIKLYFYSVDNELNGYAILYCMATYNQRQIKLKQFSKFKIKLVTVMVLRNKIKSKTPICN